MKEQIIAIEAELDEKVKNLSIWETPFQSILTQMLLATYSIEKQKGIETALDYCSRFSYIYNLIKDNAAKADANSTANSILSLNPAHVPDIAFLALYAHFSMLMPQIHRDTIVPVSIKDKKIELDFKSPETEYAEVIDRIYSYISLQVMIDYKEEKKLDEFLLPKTAVRGFVMEAPDFINIKLLQEYFKRNCFNIQVLPSSVMETEMGFNFEEYLSFTSTAKAFSYYFFRLSKCFYRESIKAGEAGNIVLADELMNEFFEYYITCHDFKFVGFYIQISGLSKPKVLACISYFLSIYSNNTGEAFAEKASCGEGFLPPFILLDSYLISSHLPLIGMLTINNILYSINKKQRKKFDEQISPHLEPVLINQLIYIFSKLDGVYIRANINYGPGEIDLMILSEKEEVCLCIQVKATISPDSSRTVERIQARALEGLEQIKAFQTVADPDKLVIVNNTFGTKLISISIIDILVVRSCAGGSEVWNQNKVVPIANYALLSSVISDKLKATNHSLKHFNKEIWDKQNELLDLSEQKKVFNDLGIDDYVIRFPNIDINMTPLISLNMRSYPQLPDMEGTHCA